MSDEIPLHYQHYTALGDRAVVCTKCGAVVSTGRNITTHKTFIDAHDAFHNSVKNASSLNLIR